MPITDTDEYIDYSSFNDAGGVTTSDTFNTWRKKTNGIINAIDGISVDNVGPDQLSAGAPTWNTAGALSTYELGSFTAGTINGTIINGSISLNGGSITGTNLKIGSGGSAATAGACHATSLAIGSTNTQFTVSASGGVAGTSLKVGGSSTTVANGGVNALSLAVGTNNTQFTVSQSGAIVGSSLNLGSGNITTTGSINVGSGSITTTGSISGTSLKVGGSSTTVANGGVNALSLAVGTNNTQFTVSSTGSVTASSFNSTSSIRFKENIQPLNNALQIIHALQGVTFDWKETGKSDIGLIAEQVNNVVPEFVLKDQEGLPQAIDYGKLTSILIEAVKELSALVKLQ